MQPVTTTEPVHFLGLSCGMSVRHKEEVAGSPGKTFVFHVTGADMTVTASCLPCRMWSLCQELWQPSCDREGRAKGIRVVGSGPVCRFGCCNKVP